MGRLDRPTANGTVRDLGDGPIKSAHDGVCVVVMNIRPATEADIPNVYRLVRGLAEYERLLHEFTATEADYRSLLFGPEHPAEALVAEFPDQRPVGVALYYRTVSTFKGRANLFLEDLFVEPVHRGKGLGKALLRRLAEIALERNGNVVEWRVLDWNQPSIEFYESLGAERMTEWHVRRLSGPALTALAKGEPWHG